MVARSLWLERRFDVNLPEDVYPLVCERLRGTPACLEDKVRGLSQAILTRSIEESWSIQEHVGQFLDLKHLWYGRIEDFLSRKSKLSPGDVTNPNLHKVLFYTLGHNGDWHLIILIVNANVIRGINARVGETYALLEKHEFFK